MEHHDFTEIYEIGGPAMKSAIENIVKIEGATRIEHVKQDTKHINECINYLLSLNDKIFKKIYLKLPNNWDKYENADEDVDEEEYIKEDKDIDEDENVDEEEYIKEDEDVDDAYDASDYAFAYVSNINLIRRCHAISPVAINKSVEILTHNNESQYLRYINLNLESCKLLYENGCNLTCLLLIAYDISDYTTIRYIIDSMSKMDLIELFNLQYSIEYFTTFGILLIDAIHKLNDAYLNKVLYNRLCKTYSTSISADAVYNRSRGKLPDFEIVLQCYYIIKYMTVAEGQKLMALQNNIYDIQINIASDKKNKTLINKTKLFHNNLLEFHFKPRGSHTKAANTS
jgi:hypothetical protein